MSARWQVSHCVGSGHAQPRLCRLMVCMPMRFPSNFRRKGFQRTRMEGRARHERLDLRGRWSRGDPSGAIADAGRNVDVVRGLPNDTSRGRNGPPARTTPDSCHSHIISFTSSSTVRNFLDLFSSKEEMVRLVGETSIACIGPDYSSDCSGGRVDGACDGGPEYGSGTCGGHRGASLRIRSKPEPAPDAPLNGCRRTEICSLLRRRTLHGSS